MIARRHATAARLLGGAAALCMAALATPSPAFAASLHGKVRYDGPPPERPTIYMSAVPACDKLAPKGIPSEELVVDAGGGLANAIVYVQAGLPKDYPAPAPGPAVRIRQKACAYVPHVLGVQAGQEVEITNDDPAFHNLDAKTALNTPFHEAMPAENQVIRKSFPHPEVAVKLKCDLHPWMAAYIGVFANPFFAVTGPDGSFRIEGLPESKYTVVAWHETLGWHSVKVELDDDDDDTAVDFSFAGN